MKFMLSLFSGIFISIVLLILAAFIFKCDHTDKITSFSFEPEKSTATSYVKTRCEDCNQRFYYQSFRGNPSDTSYIDIVKEHTADNEFVNGEYDTINAKVRFPDFFSPETEITCYIQKGNTYVYFSVEFKGDYEEAVSLLQEGDEITFYGKSALTGLSWVDCELITK